MAMDSWIISQIFSNIDGVIAKKICNNMVPKITYYSNKNQLEKR